jgi:ubiquinone/menaquinone biosynthesis C-methylase UbiE
MFSFNNKINGDILNYQYYGYFGGNMNKKEKFLLTFIGSLILISLFSCLNAEALARHVESVQYQTLSRKEALEKTLDIAGVQPGLIIGEVGAGEGFFTADLVTRLGGEGKIYANDIDKDSLDILTNKGFQNVETILGETDDPAFPDNNLDMVIMRSVFHDLENPLSMLENIKKYLKPNAPLVVVESHPSEENQKRMLKMMKCTSTELLLPIHNMTREELLTIVDQSSFILESETSFRAWWSVYVFKEIEDRGKNVWPNWLRRFRAEVEKIQELEKDKDVSFVKKRIAWERILNSYRDNSPLTAEDEQLREYINKRIAFLNEEANKFVSPYKNKETAISHQPGEPSVFLLRSDFKSIDWDGIEKIFQNLGFETRAKIRAISGDFPNQFESMSVKRDKVVVDKASWLMWHQSGSEEPLDFFMALEWIDDLNSKRFAGYSDWRLPTVEEAASLMEIEKKNGDLLIDPVFSNVQGAVWTGDSYYPGRLWLARYYRSGFADDLKIHIGWVRPVRSLK